MSVLNERETAEIRQQLLQRFGIDLQEKITRVEFVSPLKTGVYFHVYDSFQPPKPPEEKTEYLLLITDGDDTRALPFKTEQRLKAAFDSFKKLEQYKLAATVNGETRWKFIPKK